LSEAQVEQQEGANPAQEEMDSPEVQLGDPVSGAKLLHPAGMPG